MLQRVWLTQSELHNLIIQVQNAQLTEVDTFPDLSNTSYYNLKYRLIIISNHFNLLSNSTSALIELLICSEVSYL